MGPAAEPWLRDYILLAFRVDKQLRAHESYLVDAYYGPPEWRALADAEPLTLPGQLVHAAIRLADELPSQAFTPQRRAYLAKQVRAIETISRKLGGETFAPEEEVERCLDIRPGWIAEDEFERGLALYEAALPVAGSLAERYQSWRTRHELPRDKAHLLPSLLQRTLAEARRRTLAFVELPAEEHVSAETITGQLYGAANWYLGSYRSRLELNTDLPVNLAALVDLMCHEAYPGHHTEFSLKEQRLYREQQQIEQSLFLVMTPQLVITEGIARLAASIVFTPQEEAQWLTEQVLSAAEIEADPATLVRMRQAADATRGVSGNAWLMLREGRSQDEVLRYIMRYTLWPEQRADKLVRLMQQPYLGAYVFSYFYGQQLMEPLLHGPDRQQIFRRFLTEPFTPEQLRAA